MSLELMRKQQAALFQIETLPRESKPKDFVIKCEVGKNAMAAAIRVDANNPDCAITEFDLLKALMDRGVCVGIDYIKIEEILTERQFNKAFKIAEGFLPRPGEDAKLIPAVELADLKAPAGAKKPGTPVDLDQVVVRKQPATMGMPGFTTLGERIEAEGRGKDVEFEIGANLAVSADGLSLVSTIPGLAGLIDGKPCVVDADYGEWKFDVKLRKENMEAVIVITPGELARPEITEEMIAGLLASNRVKFGIEPRITTLIPPAISMTTMIKAAAGKAPAQGRAGVITERFKDKKDAQDNIYKIEKGELIVERLPAEPGKPGMNVLGEEIPADPVADVSIMAGPNTKLSEDGNKLYSTIDGFLSHTKDGYGVAQVKDFDAEKNELPERIDFEGMIRVRGDVKDGRSIIAGSHIIITGNVGSSDIVSGGLLKIEGSVRSGGKARIQSTGDMRLGSVESARLRAGGNVYVAGKALNSEIVTNGGLFGVKNNTFTISGGKVISAGSVEVDVIGDESNTATYIESGIPLQIRAKYDQTVRDANELTGKNAAIVEEMKRLAALAKTGALPAGDYERIKKLKLLYQITSEKQRQITGQMSKLLPAIMKMAGAVTMTVNECAYPGAVLSLGVHKQKIDREVRSVILKPSHDAQSVAFQAIKQSERREVTIVFTDIVGYSNYTSKYGDGAANELVTTHNGLLFPLVTEFKGRIIKTIGDSIMAVFNESDNAVACAIKMQNVLDVYNKSKPDEHKIKIRIGMNTGMGIIEGDDIFGDVVNMAARVESLAGGDEIFISDMTYQTMKDKLAGSIFSLGMKKLKGKEEPVEVLSVEWS